MVERHAQVGEDAVDRAGLIVTQEVGHETEIAVDHRETRVVHRAGDGVLVLVEAVEMPVGAEAFDDGPGVSAAAIGRVDIHSAGLYVQGFESLWQKRRDMVNILIHNFLRVKGYGTPKIGRKIT